MARRLFPLLACLLIAAAGVAASGGARKGAAVGFHLESPAFQAGASIPKQFTCEGSDESPGLKWTDPPEGTRTFALIADDPDAPVGTWVHWVAFNLAANTTELPQAVPRTEQINGGGKQGMNDFRRLGYGGPCPPPGKPHRYFFRLYALDTTLDLKPGCRKGDVERAMKGHVLGTAELMGTYGRSK